MLQAASICFEDHIKRSEFHSRLQDQFLDGQHLESSENTSISKHQQRVRRAATLYVCKCTIGDSQARKATLTRKKSGSRLQGHLWGQKLARTLGDPWTLELLMCRKPSGTGDILFWKKNTFHCMCVHLCVCVFTCARVFHGACVEARVELA